MLTMNGQPESGGEALIQSAPAPTHRFSRRHSSRLSYNVECIRKATQQELEGEREVILKDESTSKVEGYVTTTTTIKITQTLKSDGKIKFHKSEEVNIVYEFVSTTPGVGMFSDREPVLPKPWFYDISLRQMYIDFAKEHDAESRRLLLKLDTLVVYGRMKAAFGPASRRGGKMFYKMYFGKMGSVVT